jgi:hypothetical protein
MHGCPSRDHVHIGTPQNLQAFRNEVSNSHGKDSRVELGGGSVSPWTGGCGLRSNNAGE